MNAPHPNSVRVILSSSFIALRHGPFSFLILPFFFLFWVSHLSVRLASVGVRHGCVILVSYHGYSCRFPVQKKIKKRRNCRLQNVYIGVNSY